MLIQLPNEDAVIHFGEAVYVIPFDWNGVHDIVSECGWWIGQVNVVQNEDTRYVDWLSAYSLVFDEEIE